MNSSYVLIRIPPFRKTRIGKNRPIGCLIKDTDVETIITNGGIVCNEIYDVLSLIW